MQRVLIIFIELAYDDNHIKTKERSAILADFDDKVVLLKWTSKVIRTHYDYLLKKPESADLKKGSVLRCNHIISVPNDLKCEKHGDLSERYIITVEIIVKSQ